MLKVISILMRIQRWIIRFLDTLWMLSRQVMPVSCISVVIAYSFTIYWRRLPIFVSVLSFSTQSELIFSTKGMVRSKQRADLSGRMTEIIIKVGSQIRQIYKINLWLDWFVVPLSCPSKHILLAHYYSSFAMTWGCHDLNHKKIRMTHKMTNWSWSNLLH